MALFHCHIFPNTLIRAKRAANAAKNQVPPCTSMYLHVPLRTYLDVHIYIYTICTVPTYHIFPPAILPASPGIEATLHGVPTTPCAEEAATLWCENLGTPHQSSKRFQKTTVKPKLYD